MGVSSMWEKRVTIKSLEFWSEVSKPGTCSLREILQHDQSIRK